MDEKYLKSVGKDSFKRDDLAVEFRFDDYIADMLIIRDSLLLIYPKYNKLSSIDRDIVNHTYNRFFEITESIRGYKIMSHNVQENNSENQKFKKNIIDFKKKFNSEVLPIKNNLIDNRDEVNKGIDEVNKGILENSKMLEELRKFSVNKITEKESGNYSSEADNKLRLARGFGVAAIVLVLIILISMYHFYDQLESMVANGKNIESIVVNILSRLVFVAVLSWTVNQSIKNYDINMHLYNLNIHRKNSMESFKVLYNSVDDNGGKNLIINEMSKAMFLYQDDGYLLNQNKKNLTIGQITELIKAVNPK